MLKSLRSVTEIFRRQKLTAILTKFIPYSLVGVSSGIFQRALVDESGMIRTQMGKQNIS
jgi:hypothetical protein